MRTIKLTPEVKLIKLQPFEESLPATFPHRVKSAGTGLTRTATMKEWLSDWLENDIRPARERTTYYCYANIVNTHLIPALGRVRLCDMTPRLIESYYAWVTENKHLASNTVRKHHILLHTALKKAYCQGLLPDNPVERVRPPKLTPARQTFYNAKQAARLLAMVEGQELELPVKLACCLGLRRSEIVGLRWCDVDLVRGSLAIRQVRTSAGGGIVCKVPKTSGSMRTLSICTVPGLVELLQRQSDWHHQLCQTQGVAWKDTFCVVVDQEGVPWDPNRLTRVFAALVRTTGLPKVTLHGLRHTFASVANDARVPMLEISKTLGHSDPIITARIYTHVFDQTHGDALAAVAAGIAQDHAGPERTG